MASVEWVIKPLVQKVHWMMAVFCYLGWLLWCTRVQAVGWSISKTLNDGSWSRWSPQDVERVTAGRKYGDEDASSGNVLYVIDEGVQTDGPNECCCSAAIELWDRDLVVCMTSGPYSKFSFPWPDWGWTFTVFMKLMVYICMKLCWVCSSAGITILFWIGTLLFYCKCNVRASIVIWIICW